MSPLRYQFVSLFLMSFLLGKANALRAESRCGTQVWYEWERKGESNPIRLIVLQPSIQGATSEEARRLLTSSLPEDLRKANLICSKHHMSSSRCIAESLSSFQTTLLRASFSSRRILEEKITADCESLQGNCKKTGFDEIQCSEIAVQKTEAPPASAADVPKTKEGKK